ncbi:MAG: hypothetical protein ACRC14_05870, partial [Paracoccaceae bacterium]
MNTISRGASLAVLMMMTGGAAQAAITADQLWTAWKDAGTAAGVTLSAETEAREGSALRLSGVTISMPSPDDPAVVIEAVLDEILMTEGADGTVTVVPSAELTMATEDEAGSAEMTISHDGMQMVVTENAGEMTYDVTGASLAAEFVMSTVGSTASADGTMPKADTNVSL